MNIAIVVFLLILPLNVFASCSSDCVKEPTCYELGYRKNIDCPTGYISCPLDTSYIWCKQYKCSDGRYNSNYTDEVGWNCEDVVYHGVSCLNCECVAPSEFRWNLDNIGSGTLSGEKACNGNYNMCISPCVPADVNVPANAEVITCTACGRTVKTGFKCNDGYTGNNCNTAVACPAGSATSAQYCPSDSEFISTNIKGYSGSQPCYECRSTICQQGTSQTYIDADLCGNSGSKGWTSAPTELNLSCYQCIAKTCSADFQLQAFNCATTGNKGYTLDNNEICYEGDIRKYKCVPNGCNSGNDTSYHTVQACMDAKGYKSLYGVSVLQAEDDYDGETVCYQCKCQCDTVNEYKWTNDNVGQYGKVDGNVCCNGKNYSSCSIDTDSLPVIEIPENAGPVYPAYPYTACNGTQEIYPVIAWECNYNYVSNYNKTSCIPCSIGSVYHADGNCTEYGSVNYRYKVFTERIPPIGVVFQINDPNKGTAGRVVSLRDLRLNNRTNLNSIKAWHEGNYSMMNDPFHGSFPMVWKGSSLSRDVLSDSSVNGKVATAKLIAEHSWDISRSSVAAVAAYYFKLPEIYGINTWSTSYFMDGFAPNVKGVLDWYLPSSEELKIILATKKTYFDSSDEPQSLEGVYYGLRSQVNNTLNLLANDEQLIAEYEKAYDGIPATIMDGIYMSSSINPDEPSNYISVDVNNGDTEDVPRASDNAFGKIKARAVLNFDKCSAGTSIYPNSHLSETDPKKWEHHIGMKCR